MNIIAPSKALDDITEDYAQAGFNGHLAFGKKPVLVIIDVVEAYLQPSSPLYSPRFQVALESNVRLLHAARMHHIPVIFTNVEYGAGGIDGGVFYRKSPVLKCFLRGSPLGEFPEILQPLADDLVVTKQYASAFFGTSLASTLTAVGADTLLLSGFSTSGCVRASTLDALQHGFIPFVVRDACGDRDAQSHDSNLFDLGTQYAEVISEQEAISLLDKRS
jgi:maleamate amidohydrolase